MSATKSRLTSRDAGDMTGTAYKRHGWVVTEYRASGERDGAWLVMDPCGHVYATCDTRTEAVLLCNAEGNEEYRKAITGDITYALSDTEVPTRILEVIKLLLAAERS